MGWHSLPLLLLLSFLSFCGASRTFTVCSYNLQRFNSEKAADYKVMHTLKRVLSFCDVSLLQNVLDNDGKAITTLLNSLNNRASDRYDDYQYKSVSSKGLGNSPDDMQKYVFIYRTQTVNLTSQFQYEGKKSFLRSPFVVQFQSSKTAIKKFVLVPLHSDPDQAGQEIDQLYEVFLEAMKKFNNPNVMFLGDFHASCAYLTKSSRKSVRLYKNSSFSWLIGDKVDTTVGEDTNCAYDRIVVHGEPFLKAIKPYSAKVFDISKEFKLTKTKVKDLSDHHPIMVTLKSSGYLQTVPPILLLCVSWILWSFLSSL